MLAAPCSAREANARGTSAAPLFRGTSSGISQPGACAPSPARIAAAARGGMRGRPLCRGVRALSRAAGSDAPIPRPV